MKSHQNLEPNLTPFYGQIHRKSIKINQNPDQFLYYPLIEIHRKSDKIDNKFIKNQ